MHKNYGYVDIYTHKKTQTDFTIGRTGFDRQDRRISKKVTDDEKIGKPPA